MFMILISWVLIKNQFNLSPLIQLLFFIYGLHKNEFKKNFIINVFKFI
jgi:hypothetical protein